MAKDPACLFYWGDWQGGTVTLTRHLKGCYMDLLTAQFNNGPLSLDEIKTVLGTDFGSAWPALQKKFVKGESGLFFNERLQAEKDKRTSYVSSRRRNLKPHMGVHMDNGNENRIGSENGKQDRGAGGRIPADAARDADLIRWEEWGNLIVQNLDHLWQGMQGRKVTREEMNAFISVASRNEWVMDSQQQFRVSLRGFDARNGTTQQQQTIRQQPKDLRS